MKKSEEALKELEDSIPEYIKNVGEFQYENENYTLAGHYLEEGYTTCEICGHERIVEVYLLKDSAGKSWRCGNVCINKISNQKISEWFQSYKQKKDNIEKNAQLIDKVSEILDDYDSDVLPIFISTIGIDRLRKMLDRMLDGKNPNEKTEKLAYFYINKIANEK